MPHDLSLDQLLSEKLAEQSLMIAELFEKITPSDLIDIKAAKTLPGIMQLEMFEPVDLKMRTS